MLELLKALVSLTALTITTVSTTALVPVSSELAERFKKIEVEVEIMKKIQEEHPACFLLSPSKNRELFEALCPFPVEYHLLFIPENISQITSEKPHRE